MPVPLVPRVVRQPVMLRARYGQRDRVLCVVLTERPLRRAWFCAGVVGACGCQSRTMDRDAEHAAVADAAVRLRDRCVFDRQYRANVIPIYQDGAAKRQPVGLYHVHSHCCML